MTTKPEVATNRNGNTVAAALAGYWQHLLERWSVDPDFAIATAFFNPGGFVLLADQLESAGNVRLLIGAEPDVAEDMYRLRRLRTDILPEDDRRARLQEALREHHAQIEEDRNLIDFARTEDARVRSMIDWLRSGNVEVRRLEKGFLHGKAFVVETDKEGVLAGSSNFTYAGLTRNIELNLGQYQPHVVGEVLDWFNELWAEAAPFDIAGLYEQRFAAHPPYVVYLRMLWERYRHELDRDDPPPGLPLTQFQRDGLYRAIEYLHRNNGVLIADGVGLGKTWLAGELIRQAREDRRQRVLLIAPAALRDGPWEQFLREHDLKDVQCVSFQELAADPRVGGTGNRVLWYDPDDYAMIVIDEAHAYRNPDTDRAATLRRLLAGSPPKQVVLLTATPVNNSLWDLYNLIAYFVRNDALFLDAGIGSLRRHFAEAEAEDPEQLSPDKLFDVLDAVAVRRTRRFIKRFYPHERIRRGDEEITITFPEPVVHRVDYDLEGALPGLFHRFAHAIGVDPDDDNPLPSPSEFEYGDQLSLARYAPSAYLLEEDPDTYELQAAGLLRSGLLKRFESSAYAFAQTCRNMAASHDVFLEALDAGWALTGDALAAWAKTDSDEFDPDQIGRGRREPADLYDRDELGGAVQADRDLLLDFAHKAEQVTVDNDPKLDALVDELAQIAEQAAAEGIDADDERDKRKVIVFSYYADTVEWIRRRLEHASTEDARLAAFRDRFTTITGSSGGTEDALFGFAPVSAQAPPDHPDAYDLLVSTDVLAEGVNLQQARHIVNFDLPWNPMRLVQRHGRIDRIGSPHKRVFLRCLFPNRQLDELLGLETALQRKITQAAKSVGVEGEIVPGSKVHEQVFAHTQDQITKLRAEDPTLFKEAEETGALSGEEFRRELADALGDPLLRDAVLHLPWVSGSGKTADGPGGFVFCTRVGDHPRPIYRWVPLNQDGSLDLDGISEDTLTCLAKAASARDTDRVLPDELRDLAYDAWETARSHILERWLVDADPRSVAPAVPKPMRDAADLLRAHPPADMDLDRLHRLLDAIEAPYDTRTQRMLRQALDSADGIAEQVQAVIQLVDELGLQPPPPVEPLPEIDLRDVHLVCWMALTSADDS